MLKHSSAEAQKACRNVEKAEKRLVNHWVLIFKNRHVGLEESQYLPRLADGVQCLVRQPDIGILKLSKLVDELFSLHLGKLIGATGHGELELAEHIVVDRFAQIQDRAEVLLKTEGRVDHRGRSIVPWLPGEREFLYHLSRGPPLERAGAGWKVGLVAVAEQLYGADGEHFGEVGELGNRDGGLPFRLDVEDDGCGDGVVRMSGIDLMGEFLGGQSRELPVSTQQLPGCSCLWRELICHIGKSKCIRSENQKSFL